MYDLHLSKCFVTYSRRHPHGFKNTGISSTWTRNKTCWIVNNLLCRSPVARITDVSGFDWTLPELQDDSDMYDDIAVWMSKGGSSQAPSSSHITEPVKLPSIPSCSMNCNPHVCVFDRIDT